MCGIGGGVNFDGKIFPEKNRLKHFIEPMKYRGPDAEGYLERVIDNVAVSLGHKRLSIIDLSELANQPMISISNKSIIVFNGEIYNYKDLKKELLTDGVAFKTNSDTEVIINGFEHWGIDKLLVKLDGMFAFALYSVDQRALYLVRDRFGKKPLYFNYNEANNNLVFSSDIRSFEQLALPKRIDLHALGYFFSELSTPVKDSIWQEIKKIPPGCFLKFTVDGIKITKYWSLNFKTYHHLPREEILESVENYLRKAVKKRLIADVNVAALLSGGVDSSLVVALMAQESDKPVSTYTVGFTSNKFNEIPYAREVANRYNTNHTEIMLSPNELEVVDELIDEFGEPFADSSMIPSYLVSKEISRSEKVALGGDGGDELFGGYFQHYFSYKYDKIKSLKWLSTMVNFTSKKFKSNYRINMLKSLLDASHQPPYMLLNRNMSFSAPELEKLFGKDQIFLAKDKEHKEIWNDLNLNVDYDFTKTIFGSLKTRLVNDYLVKIDRSSMFASLEIRSPFLDYHLAEFVAELTPGQIMKGSEPKSILKEIASKYIPKELLYRNKKGFEIPIGEWFRKELKDNLFETVLGGKQKLIDMNYGEIEVILKKHIDGQELSHRIWTLYVFHKWAQKLEV